MALNKKFNFIGSTTFANGGRKTFKQCGLERFNKKHNALTKLLPTPFGKKLLIDRKNF
jgi:hypothetical protein